MKFAMFMLGEYLGLILISCMIVTLFFGGWQVPYLNSAGWNFPGMDIIAVSPWLIAVLQLASFAFKVLFFCWLQILVRWTVPRFRYDQLMNLGWKGMIPLALANLLLTALAVLLWGEMA